MQQEQWGGYEGGEPDMGNLRHGMTIFDESGCKPPILALPKYLAYAPRGRAMRASRWSEIEVTGCVGSWSHMVMSARAPQADSTPCAYRELQTSTGS